MSSNKKMVIKNIEIDLDITDNFRILVKQIT